MGSLVTVHRPMTDTTPALTIPGPTCYPRPMPDLNTHRIGDGPRCYAVWLDHWPVFLDGLDGLPHIGDRFEIDGDLRRHRRSLDYRGGGVRKRRPSPNRLPQNSPSNSSPESSQDAPGRPVPPRARLALPFHRESPPRVRAQKKGEFWGNLKEKARHVAS
jgi:hypothetical protein